MWRKFGEPYILYMPLAALQHSRYQRSTEKIFCEGRLTLQNGVQESFSEPNISSSRRMSWTQTALREAFKWKLLLWSRTVWGGTSKNVYINPCCVIQTFIVFCFDCFALSLPYLHKIKFARVSFSTGVHTLLLLQSAKLSTYWIFRQFALVWANVYLSVYWVAGLTKAMNPSVE